MPPGPFGNLVACHYTAEDLSDYAIGVPAELAGAVGLLPSAPGALPFPALWITRYLSCSIIFRPGIDPAKWHVRVPCQSDNATWTTGPGALITISGYDYRVTRCLGESRID